MDSIEPCETDKSNAQGFDRSAIANALKDFKFKRTGVKTVVTTRADVEAAFSKAKFVSSRIRKANALWAETYGHADDCEFSPSKVTFPTGTATSVPTPSQILEFEVEDGNTIDCPAPWSIGAGVSRNYVLKIAERANKCVLDSAIRWPPFPVGYSPNAVWEALSPTQMFQDSQRVRRATAGCELPPVQPAHIRFVCISDTHSAHDQLTEHLPPGDVLLHAGDFTLRGDREEIKRFAQWIGKLPYVRKIVIAGNHDLPFDAEFCEETSKDAQSDAETLLAKEGGDTVTYLRDSEVEIYGVRIYGSPWQPEFGNWAFMRRRGQALAEKWAAIPSGVDVLMVHGPPLGRGDACKSGNRAGCADLLKTIQSRVKPVFFVSGHIHESAGISFDGTTHYINAASVDEDNRCGTRMPWVFDLPRRCP